MLSFAKADRFSLPEGRKPLVRGKRHKSNLVRVVEDGRGNGTAEIDVKAAPNPFSSGAEKPTKPWPTPQFTVPRFLTACKVCASPLAANEPMIDNATIAAANHFPIQKIFSNACTQPLFK